MENTLESYILKTIKKIETQLNELHLTRNDYSHNSYIARFNNLCGRRDVLYMCLTAHDNKYDELNDHIKKNHKLSK